MTQPLALVLYDRLLPGTQLVNRLQDLNYRVEKLSEAAQLVAVAQQIKPMLVLADLQPLPEVICGAIRQLKQTTTTSHLPVIAFGVEEGSESHRKAVEAGVTLVVGEVALLSHLPELLDQALQV